MESRSRASPEQFAALLEFMESHGDLTRPQQGPQGRIKADRLWLELVQMLNSLGGGVLKPLEKWKKVWADWKTKTKKKSLGIRCEASGTGGGPSSRQTLTALEERLLGIMGLSAVFGQAGIEERGFDALPPQISATEQFRLNLVPSVCKQESTACPPSEEISSRPAPRVQTPPPGTASTIMPSATSPSIFSSRGATQQWQHRATLSQAASPNNSTPRHRGQYRARARRRPTPLERTTSEFVAVENRRLQYEEDREIRLHEREIEKLRIEARRVNVEENNNIIFRRLTDIVDNFLQNLPQLIPSSLPSTDIIP